jgi:F0F1-type ATP synthase alpha subunit
LNRGVCLIELLKQGQYVPMPIEEQVVSVFSGVKGYLDKVDPKDVTRFEEEFLPFVKANHKDVLESIANEGVITPATEEKLHTITSEFANSFVSA